MADKEIIIDKVFKFKVRCLGLHRKLFSDYQEREISPEIKELANEMDKLARSGDFAAAAECNRKVIYLVKMICQIDLITEEMYESFRADSDEIAALLSEAGE